MLRSATEALYVRRLTRALDGGPRPRHVAILLDADGRGDRGTGQTGTGHTAAGSRAGGAKIRDVLRWCDAAGIRHVTVWVLPDDTSAHRTPDRSGPLSGVVEETVACMCTADEDWRIEVAGPLDRLPEETVRTLEEAVARTASRTGLSVGVAVGRSGRSEIVDTVRAAFRQHVSAGGDPRDLAEDFDLPDLSGHLRFPAPAGDADFVIRTSAEQRLSGFLLRQPASGEVHFVEVLWPDFRRTDLLRALRSYAARDRGHDA
ncbi:putative undecaprenyl diphosphate synthase [Actinacidiphila reveromycinica]|uniref:Putative undecaprenyl diphosphate synthase n=2 Tax=Actinacidiphila reveromycinica TaxID=659352 RepID=A0A7U3USS3_9ACTN|nr:putative undecaprenyl diphosphate synthase [Streptomyces sp. SN-593]